MLEKGGKLEKFTVAGNQVSQEDTFQELTKRRTNLLTDGCYSRIEK